MSDRNILRLLAISAAIVLVLGAHSMPSDADSLDPLRQWGQWRGPEATGAALHAEPPVTWSETENVKWKAAIPGVGHASPIVWGDRVFILTAIKTERQAQNPERARGGQGVGERENRHGRRREERQPRRLVGAMCQVGDSL